ncbi:hypothetical protein DXV75_04850 [Alteromonas aestuariivivens]|uniref:Uncharacterized protein n=1 Tax=Alteromonas aestuariivivens TaxID=1938339 RepID=A0A3D8MBG0_9ALTE|nr:hypothetical protein [Alteromonas aestuariivivens]RDV27366.1 hypothetical protein DXV75_04850 [Alteromonas aestuariivivens]
MKTGDWVDTLHGIGKVISIHPLYADEFDVLFSNKTLGEKLQDIVIYKVFCDFKGNIKKRVHFDSGDSSLCTPLCQESQNIINRLSTSHLKEIDNFSNKTSKKKFGNWLYLYLNYNDNQFNALKSLEGVKYPISFTQYSDLISELNLDLKIRHYNVDPSSYITLSFFHENYEYIKGQRVFTKVNCTHIEGYA